MRRYCLAGELHPHNPVLQWLREEVQWEDAMRMTKLSFRLYGITLGMMMMAHAAVSRAEVFKKMAPKLPFPAAFEFKPLATTLDMVPGPGVAGEVFFADKVSVFLQGSYTDADLPGARMKDYGVDSKKNAVPIKGYGYGYAAGARWYNSPESDSWYADAGIGYSQHNATWEYKDQRVKGRLETVLPGVSGGYRWRWSNGFLVRLGAGIAANGVASSSAKAEDPASPDAKEAEKKVKNITTQATVGGVDLGLGYMF